MKIKNEITIEQNQLYDFRLIEGKSILMFIWKHSAGLSVQDFQEGIVKLATHCKTYKPARVVIEATELDQGSPAIAWLRGQNSDADIEDYTQWWMANIVPSYHESAINSLAVATGDSNAPGELQQSPPGVNFKMGYFHSLGSALQWHVS